MKKLTALLLVAILLFSVTAFASESNTVVVPVPDAEGNLIDVTFPVDPQRVVCLNWQTVDFLDAVGLGDRIVGLIKQGSYPEHLKKYIDNENIADVGGMKNVDLEAVMSLEPDVIFSSDRTEKSYDKFSMIAPTMSASVNYEDGFMNSYATLASKHGKIFGIGDAVADIIDGYNARIAEIAKFADGKTALLGIFAGGLNTLGNVGRCSVVVNEMGFKNLAGEENVNHGNLSSYEAYLELNPDYMFILDKDTAVGTEAVAATEQMDNDIIKQTNAYKNGNIVFLTPGAAWYIADGGITSLDLMIECIEKGIGLK